MSLRVLLFGTEFPPSAAGTASYAHSLATGLQAAGATVRVLTQAPSGADPVHMADAPQAESSDRSTGKPSDGAMDIRRIPHTAWALNRYRVCRKALLEELADFNPHCLWTTNGMGTRVAGLLPDLAAGTLSMISCVRGSDISTRLPGRTPLRWIESLFHRRCYRHSAAIAVVSRALCEVAVAKGLPSERLFLSPPAFDLRLSQNGPQTTRRSPSTILTVARLRRQKRIDVLLRALENVRHDHPEVKLVVVGDGPQRARLEQLAADLDVASHVEFVGAVAPRSSQLFDYYRTSSIFALASVGEGLGNVFIEAGAFGLPSIGCNDGGTPDVVLNEETGLLVPPDDVDAVTEALRRLLTEGELRGRLGSQAKEWISQNFSVVALGQSSYQTIQQVVGKDA